MSTDINERFRAQRSALIAATGGVRREDGTYAATVGYDRGEVIGRDGLDTSLGRAALYSAVPAWHGLGCVIPGGISDINSVLDLGGIAFRVEKRRVQYEVDGALRAMADRWVTVRMDTGAALGTVGARYQIFQQLEIFTFLQDLVAEHDVIWESAGALREGRKVFITLRVPESVVIDRGGLDDEVILFIVVINSHDGTSGAEAVATPWRVVCGNTERFALRDAVSRWSLRHTSGALQNLAEARRTLGLSVRYAQAFEAEETALARTDLAINDFHKLIAELWPLDDEAAPRARRIAERRRDRLDVMFRDESEQLGHTAYAAERVVTDYLDHIAPRRPGKTMSEEIARATAVLEGSDDDLKSTAHKRLMNLRAVRTT
ncbi:DUF932 domain-containing protein [Streptomyces sp. NPDC059009]|uniref:DUF932 domain-containing protein n=1 Tax=Streptomyces sp. NPDC059009 TaxID=3346694 RepID=UPI00369D04EC